VSIAIIVQVMHYSPRDLTPLERVAAMVFAEDSNKDTRELYHPLSWPEYAWSIGVRTEKQVHALAAALARKGVLERVRRGQRNGPTVYRFAEFNTTRPPEAPPLETGQRGAARGVNGRFAPASLRPEITAEETPLEPFSMDEDTALRPKTPAEDSALQPCFTAEDEEGDVWLRPEITAEDGALFSRSFRPKPNGVPISKTLKTKNLTTPRANSGPGGAGAPARGAEPTAAPPETNGAEVSKESAEPKTTPEDSPEFERFWEAYPRKMAKGAARRAWAKVLAAGVDVELVIAAAEAAAEQQKAIVELEGKAKKKFTPYPATWLNAEGWENELEPVERELNRAERRNRENLAGAVQEAERAGIDPLALLFPGSLPADHPDVLAMKAETEEWLHGPAPRPVLLNGSQGARRGAPEGPGGPDWAPGGG